MNKRYIDFVPTKGASDKEVKVKATRASVSSTRARSVATSGTSAKKVETKVVMARSAQVSNSKQAVRVGQSRKTSVVYRSMPEMSQASSRKVKRGLRMDDDSGLGVIEDLNTKFVKNEIEKRPLGGTRPVVKDELKVAKSKKLLGRRMRKTGVEPVEKPVENSARNSVGSAGKATYKMPNHPFINQEKVIKRPLSKNMYQKSVATSEEKASGPVAIIEKPAKDKNVSMVVTIIITIILGAAAGTVAFLLLPK